MKRFWEVFRFYNTFKKNFEDLKVMKVESQLMAAELIADVFVFNTKQVTTENVATIFNNFIEKFPILEKSDSKFYVNTFGIITIMHTSLIRKLDFNKTKEALTLLFFKQILELKKKGYLIQGKDDDEIVTMLQRLDTSRKTLA